MDEFRIKEMDENPKKLNRRRGSEMRRQMLEALLTKGPAISLLGAGVLYSTGLCLFSVGSNQVS